MIDVLIGGGAATNSATELLSAGAAVWALNVIAFALLYWELDGGGAPERAHGLRPHPGPGVSPAHPTRSSPR